VQRGGAAAGAAGVQLREAGGGLLCVGGAACAGGGLAWLGRGGWGVRHLDACAVDKCGRSCTSSLYGVHTFNLTPLMAFSTQIMRPRQIDSRQLLQVASDRHRVRFYPGPSCHGRPRDVRLSFSFYSPAELRLGVQRLADALEESLEESLGAQG